MAAVRDTDMSQNWNLNRDGRLGASPLGISHSVDDVPVSVINVNNSGIVLLNVLEKLVIKKPHKIYKHFKVT